MPQHANRLDRSELVGLIHQISRHTDRLLEVLVQLLDECSDEEQKLSRHQAWIQKSLAGKPSERMI